MDHGCLDVIVAEELLDRPDVVAVLQQMGGEATAEGVAQPAWLVIPAAPGRMWQPAGSAFSRQQTRLLVICNRRFAHLDRAWLPDTIQQAAQRLYGRNQAPFAASGRAPETCANRRL